MDLGHPSAGAPELCDAQQRAGDLAEEIEVELELNWFGDDHSESEYSTEDEEEEEDDEDEISSISSGYSTSVARKTPPTFTSTYWIQALAQYNDHDPNPGVDKSKSDRLGEPDIADHEDPPAFRCLKFFHTLSSLYFPCSPQTRLVHLIGKT